MKSNTGRTGKWGEVGWCKGEGRDGVRWDSAKVREETICSVPMLSRADNHDFQFEWGAAVCTVAFSLLLFPELVPALPPAPTNAATWAPQPPMDAQALPGGHR